MKNTKQNNELSKYDIFEFMTQPYNDNITRSDDQFFIIAKNENSIISGHLMIAEEEIRWKNESFHNDYFQYNGKIYRIDNHIEFTPNKNNT